MSTFRRVKKVEAILEDPNTPYRVGQLIGACDMAAHWMTLQDDEETKAMGNRLHGVLNWWFEEVKVNP
jgi:hypothetical protein